MLLQGLTFPLWFPTEYLTGYKNVFVFFFFTKAMCCLQCVCHQASSLAPGESIEAFKLRFMQELGSQFRKKKCHRFQLGYQIKKELGFSRLPSLS